MTISSNVYKVVKIINDKRLVINYGEVHGAKRGQELEIFVPTVDVIDPETNTSLGILDFIKANITIENVMDKMSVCISDDYYEKNDSPAAWLNPNTTVTTRRRLNVESTQISGGFEDINRKIVVGDLVRPAKG